jgi:hypothetical protein
VWWRPPFSPDGFESLFSVSLISDSKIFHSSKIWRVKRPAARRKFLNIFAYNVYVALRDGADRFNARVQRGGSFNNNERNARCAYRNDNNINNLNKDIGFRVVASHAFPMWINPKGLTDL